MNIKIFSTLTILLLLTTCKSGESKPPIVYPLNALTTVQEVEIDKDEKYAVIIEYFVISNLSEEGEKVREVVDGYNSKTLSEAALKKYEIRQRRYYRESEDIHRDYRELLGHWAGDTIEDHNDDLALTIYWSDYGKVKEYEFSSWVK